MIAVRAPQSSWVCLDFKRHAQVLLVSGAEPILELDLVQQRSREGRYELAQACGIEFQVYVLEASREVRRERVARRNVARGPAFSMVVPDPIFEFASDMWPSPDAIEIAGHRIEVISTDS